jgi:hypothetical protein
MSKQTKTKWLVLTSAILVGCANSIATWIRGERAPALVSLALTAIIVVVVLIAGRNDTLRRRLLDRDERSDSISMFAATWTGVAVWLVTFSIYLVEFARGHSGEPYYWLSGMSLLLFVFFALTRRLRR